MKRMSRVNRRGNLVVPTVMDIALKHDPKQLVELDHEHTRVLITELLGMYYGVDHTGLVRFIN